MVRCLIISAVTTTHKIQPLTSRFEIERTVSREFPELDAACISSALVVFRTSHEITLALDAHYARHGITRGRFVVLMLLFRERGHGLSPAALAEEAGVTRATMTGLLDTLTKDELVRREADPDDRRAFIVHMTKRGEKLLRAMLPDHFRRTQALLGTLTHDERDQLASLLLKLREGIPAVRDA